MYLACHVMLSAALVLGAAAPSAAQQQPPAQQTPAQQPPAQPQEKKPEQKPEEPQKYEETVVVSASKAEEKLINAPATMAQLRPKIPREDFVRRVRELEGRTGLKLAFLDDGGIQAVAGYRISDWLANGPYLEIEDLVTADGARSRGHASTDRSTRGATTSPLFRFDADWRPHLTDHARGSGLRHHPHPDREPQRARRDSS